MMDRQPRLLITPRLVVGVGIALLGLVLTLDRLRVVDADRVLRYWPVGLMVIGGLMIAQADCRGQRVRGFFFFAVGTWMFLYNERLLPAPIWDLFWPVILIFIGISMAMRPGRRIGRFGNRMDHLGDRLEQRLNERFGDGGSGTSGAPGAGEGTPPSFGGSNPASSFSGAAAQRARAEAFHDVRSDRSSAVRDGAPYISIFSVWSGVRRVSNSSAFSGGDITAIMGGAKLDLRLATIPPGQEAVLDVTAVMGGAEIVIPSTWVVSTPIVPFMGSVEDKRLPPLPVDGKIPVPDANAPRLIIRGFVMMGGVVLNS